MKTGCIGCSMVVCMSVHGKVGDSKDPTTAGITRSAHMDEKGPENHCDKLCF